MLPLSLPFTGVFAEIGILGMAQWMRAGLASWPGEGAPDLANDPLVRSLVRNASGASLDGRHDPRARDPGRPEKERRRPAGKVKTRP
jgi:hypothetical protein